MTFLGTGAMIPNEKRGHPAFLLTYKEENILIDCGEGTQIQFRKAKLNPCRVTKILITHWHGDHTFGLPGLLRTLETSGYKNKMYIYGPKGLKRHMEEMFTAFGEITEFKIEVIEVSGRLFENQDFYLEAEKMIHVQPCNAYNFIEKDKLRIDKKKLAKIKISNSPVLGKLKQGKDIIINGKKINYKSVTYLQNGRKVSIVLDTLFDDKIVKFARNSDLLICEATYLDEAELAKAYYHLTVSDAVRIAKLSKSKKLVLIHMSQRHSLNEKKFLDLAKKAFKNTEIGRDLMRFEI